MSQPTLIQIPGILGRTVLRLIARIILVGAAAFLLVGTTLALGSLLIATWRTPRTRRTTLAVDIALGLTEVLKARWRVSHSESPSK